MKKVEAGPMLHSGIRESFDQGLNEWASKDIAVVLRSEIDTQGCLAGHIRKRNKFLTDATMHEEVFGPATLMVEYEDANELMKVAEKLEGQLTASFFGTIEDLNAHADLVESLETKAGRLIFNQFPTGVEVCGAIVHGGPYPATTDGRSTSVGEGAFFVLFAPYVTRDSPMISYRKR